MKKITPLFLLAIILLCVNVKLIAQPTYSNTITLTSGNSIPLGGNVITGQCMQNIFLPGEFTGGPFNGLITTIYYRSSTSITTATTATYTNFTVKMGQTAATTLVAGTWVTAGMSQVYLNPSLVLTWPISGAANPWVQIVLQTPFAYDPSQSLIVEVGHAGMSPATTFFPIMNQSLSGVRRVFAGVPNNPPPIPTGSGADCPSFGFDEMPNGPCTNPPTAGTSTANPSTVCAATASSLNLTGNTFGSGQTYTWQSSTLIGGPYSNVSGALTTPFFSISPVATAYYRCVVTCAQSDTSLPVLVNVNPAFPGGTYTINNTLPTGGSNFISFTAAVNAMSCGISGPVVFNISSGQTFTEDVPVINVNSNVTNTLKFRKSGPGANPVIRPTGGAGTSDAGIAIVGTDYLTFDGIDINIATGTAVEFGYFVSNSGSTNGATNDSIKNCTISLSRTVGTTRGIFQNVVTAPTSAAGANSNNVYMNLTIKNVYAGIQLTGNTTFPDLNTQIITSACNLYNIIGDPAVPFDIGGGNIATQNYGIRATFQAGFTIRNNKVTNVSSTTTTDGIFIETFFGATGNLVSTLANNIVRGIRINSATATTQVNGIRITNSTATPPAGTSLRVYNNAVSDITSAYSTATGVAWASTTGIKGMNMASTTALAGYSYEIYNNSVSIDGSGSPFLHSTAFQRSVTTAGNTNNLIRNNVWANYTGAQVTPAGHYAFVNALVGSATALGVSGSAFVSNNDLYITNGTQGFAARGSTTDYATVALWQTANAQATLNQSFDPQFLNNVADLHVNNTALDALGFTYPVYLTQDLDCAPRSGTADIGAYLIVPCSGTPTAGTVSATPSSICPGSSSILSSVGFSTGVTFQWVSSAVSGGPYTAIGSAISFNYNTGPLLTNMYFKLVVTCVSSALRDSSIEVAVNIIASPSASISPPGPLAACAGAVVPLTASTNAVTPTYQWKRNGIDVGGANSATFTPTQTGSYTVSIVDLSAPAACAGLSAAVIDTVFPLPPTSASATPPTICGGDSSQLNANVFVSGVLTSPVSGTTNGSAATGFDITNISTGPITLHFFSYQSSSALGTIANQSIYRRLTPMNCVFPTNITTDPSYVLIGTVSTTSNGPVPAAPTVIPLDVNITIPPGATYAFAIGGSAQQYWNGTTGCPIMGSTAHLQVREGWGGTFTGIIGNRQWHGSVTYSYGDPNAVVAWSPATGLSSTSAVNPKASPSFVGSTTYTVTVTGTGGCTSTSSVSVTNLGPRDPAPTTLGDTKCSGAMGHLEASGLSTLNWYTAQTGGVLKHTGSTWDSAWAATTTYWVESFNGNCPSLRTAVTITVLPLPPIAATAVPTLICAGDSSQLSANVFVSGVLTSPVAGTTNGSAATGFDITNISAGPITLHFFSYQSSSVLGTVANQSIYRRLTPMNCVFPTNVTTDPSYVLIGTVATTSNGPVPAAPTVIPLDVNITIPPGATYAFAIGGSAQQYWNGTSGCPVMGSTPHLQVKEGWGGTFTGIIANRQWHGSVTYSYGDPNAVVAWSPATGLSSTSAVNPKASPPVGTTTYTVTVTGTGGCTNTSTASVTVNPIPPVPTIDSVTNIFCGCGNATLYGHINGSGTIIRWYDTPTGGTILGTGSPFVTPLFCGPKTFYAEEFDPTAGCPSSSRPSILVTPVFAVPISAGADAVLCNGAGPASLNVTSANDPNYNYSWSPSAGLNVTAGPSVTSNPGINTTYIVTGTDATSGCVNKDTVTVFVGLTPLVGSITAVPGSLCTGDTAQLNVIPTIPGGSIIGFTGAYIPSGWTTTHSAGDIGTVGTFNSASLTMVSSDGGTGATDIDVTHTVTANGTIAFNWSYTTADIDGAAFDYPQYYKNGVRTMVPGFNTAGSTVQTGVASIPVLAGDVFGFNMHTTDNTGGAATTIFDNVVFPGAIAVFAYAWSPATGMSNTTIANPKVSPPAGNTTYTVTVSNNGCTATTSISIQVTQTPPAPSCTGDTVCGQGIITLTATGTGDTLVWTDTIGGPIVGTGPSFSQYVSKSGSYFVREIPSGGSPQLVGYGGQGNTSNTGGGGQLFFPSTANAIFFKVTTANGILIQSVDIIPSTPIGTEFEIELLDSLNNSYGSFKGLTTVTNPNIPHPFADPYPAFNVQTVPINMYVPAGAWWLRPSKNPNLAVHVFPVNPTAAGPPYTIPGKLSINGYAGNTIPGTVPSAVIFGLFYNWQVLDICVGPACQANYLVTPPPPLTITPSGSTSFCGSGTVNLTGGGDPGWVNFSWAPAAGLSATTGASVTATPTVTTTYTLTANDGNPSGCVDTQTVTVTVNGAPFVSIDPPPSDSLCVGTIFTINAAAGSSSFKQIGFTEDPGQVTGQLFNGGNLTQRSQGLFRASELNGAGLFGPTAITSIAFKVSSKLSNQPYSGFTVKIGAAPTGCMTVTNYQDTGLTTCFSGNYSTVLGWNVITFTTPYSWNGTSDIIVESCFSNATSSFFDQVFVSLTPGCNTTRSTNAAPCAVGTGTLLAARPNARFTGGTVNFSWAPPTELSSSTVEDPVYTSASPGSKSYTVTVSDPATGCTSTASINFVVSTKPKSPTIAFIGDSVFCQSGLPKMREFGSNGSFQWQVSTNGINFSDLPGQNNDTLNAASITVATYYRLYAYCGDTSYSNILSTVVHNPTIVSTVGDTVCGFGQVCLSATKNNPAYQVQWFNAPVGGSALSVGDTFCTNIGSTSTFYASAATPGGPLITNSYFNFTTTLGSNIFPLSVAAGKQTQWFVAPGEFTSPTPAPSGGMITSISFFAGTAGNATFTNFELKLGQMSTPFAGGAFYSGPMTSVILPGTKTIVSTAAGTWFTLTLDVPFAYDPTMWMVVQMGQCSFTGTGISLFQNALTGVRRAWSVGGCPFVWLNTDANMPGITIGLTSGSQCLSPRVPVVAVSNTAPPMALTKNLDPICENSCGTETVNAAGIANYQVFTWAPATGLSSTIGASVTACPTITTTYTVTGIDTIGNCQRIDTVRVVVNPAPVINISATPTTICFGDSTQLSTGATGGASGTLAMPPELSTFPGSVRGYSFTAPVGFTMTGIQVLGSTVGSQSIAVVKFVPPVQPPIFSAVTNAFVTLFITQNNPATGVIPCSIPINAGDVIGILGQRATTTSYANPAGPYATTIGGQPVTLTRMGMQFPLNTTLPQDLWTETGGSIGRVEFTYGNNSTFNYSWSAPGGLSATNINNPKASPAASNTYTVTVTNTQTGCTKTATVNVNVTPVPKPYIYPNDASLCTGDVINIVARDSGAYAGGWPAGTMFDFGFGPTTDSTLFVNGPGIFNVSATLPLPMGSCLKISNNANITFRDAPVLVTNFSPVKCFGTNTGYVSAEVFLGAPPYRFKYYNSLGVLVRNFVTSQSRDTMFNAGVGQYCVVVYDTVTAVPPIPSCHSDSICIEVTQPAILAVSSTSTNPVCRGAATGTINISQTGGTSPYSYLWNGGATTQNRTGLASGTYTVTVTDANGCTKTKTTTITQPATNLIINSNQTNVRCFGLNSGVATVAPAGGSSPYTYSWNTVPVKTTASITGLIAGIYTCTVTDAIGCTKSLVMTITQPPDMVVFQAQTNVTFPGGNNGTASVTVTGGTPGYTYSWNTVPVKTTAAVTGLTAGTYKCTITDTKSCTKKVTFIITEPIAKDALPGAQAEWKIKAYPNPTSGMIMISFVSNETEPFNVSVIDYTGRLVYKKESEANKGNNDFMYDFSHLNKGIYFVKIATSEKSKTIRIVIQ